MTNNKLPVTNSAFIALGSNKGDKLDYLKKAVNEIKLENTIVKVSSIYETKSFGKIKQNNFLNAVIKIKTKFSVKELFDFLKRIEKKLGRKKTVKWGPREIDLDLLFYNDLIYSDEKITIPHEGIVFRDFVLTPLCEIEPKLKHPKLNKKICDFTVKDSEKTIICKSKLNLLETEKIERKS